MSASSLFWLAFAGVAVASGLVVVFRFKRFMANASRALATGGARMATTSAGRIEYAVSGLAEGVPLLSIHGAGGGWDQGVANSAGLVDTAFRVIAPSRFGYLGSPIPADTSPAAQADALAALLDALNIKRAIVFAVSAGAASALELALRHPDRVRALVLISPGTYSPDSPVRVDPSATSMAVLRVVNAGGDFAWWVLANIAPSMLIRFLGVRPSIVRQARAAEREPVANVMKGIEPLSMRFAGIMIDSTPKLGPLPLDKVTAPTLLIAARDDLFNTLPAAEFAAARIPNAKLCTYETGGHLLVGRSEQTRVLIAEFLRALP